MIAIPRKLPHGASPCEICYECIIMFNTTNV